MEGANNGIEHEAYPRTPAFDHLGAQGNKQRFDARPFQVFWRGGRENSLEGFSMLSIHGIYDSVIGYHWQMTLSHRIFDLHALSFIRPGILYVPNNPVGAEILFVGPGDPAMGEAHGTEIGFVPQLVEGAAAEVGFYVEDPGNTIAGQYFDPVIVQGDGLDDCVHFFRGSRLFLLQWLDFENRLAGHRQFPIGQQVFLVYLYPCLYQFEFGDR